MIEKYFRAIEKIRESGMANMHHTANVAGWLVVAHPELTLSEAKECVISWGEAQRLRRFADPEEGADDEDAEEEPSMADRPLTSARLGRKGVRIYDEC
tara:strand:+ start:174 stop:467 length:294 start_codon:yes stop_codon:yes gene_type:complete